MKVSKRKRRFAVAAFAVLTAAALLIARCPARRVRRPPVDPAPTGPADRREDPEDGPAAAELDPPLERPEPVWPEPAPPRPPRSVRLPVPPSAASEDPPPIEAAFAAPPLDALPPAPEEELGSFGRRLLRKRGQGVEIAFAGGEGLSTDIGDEAVSATARQVRLFFPEARLAAVAYGAAGARTVPLGSEDEALGRTLADSGEPLAQATSGPADALARAARLDWTPRSHRHVIFLLDKMPDLSDAAQLVRAAREFTTRTNVRVHCLGIGMDPEQDSRALRLLERTDVLRFVPGVDPDALGREILLLLLGEEERDRIQSLLDAEGE